VRSKIEHADRGYTVNAMTEKPPIGSVVRLKSGGPDMTVTGSPTTVDDRGISVEEPEKVICTWFDGSSKKTAPFNIAVLDQVEN
jgi:uncharacterized protein YodC (DUF2158 family)